MSLPTMPPQQAGEADREHRALRVMIDSIAERITVESAEPGRLNQELSDLVVKLVAHFASEEAPAGLYAQVLEQDARFAPEIARLTDEHKLMLAKAEGLADASKPLPEKQTDFQQLRQELELHEASENRLLQQAYTDEIGSKD